MSPSPSDVYSADTGCGACETASVRAGLRESIQSFETQTRRPDERLKSPIEGPENPGTTENFGRAPENERRKEARIWKGEIARENLGIRRKLLVPRDGDLDALFMWRRK